MRINVTWKDIALGDKLCECNCPVARAIKRHKRIIGVQVYSEDITIHTQKGRRSIVTPKKVRKFIDRFDDNVKVKPFSFDLKLK